LLLTCQRFYRGLLLTALHIWKDTVKVWHETKVRVEVGAEKFNRVRLSSAFVGFRVSVKEGRSAKKLTKLIFHVARRMLMRAYYTWKVGTVRMRFLTIRAVNMEKQIIVKAKTMSFDVWRGLAQRSRARNSSLDYAVSVATRGLNKHHFFKWVKETRYLRVMAHCDSVNEWIKQKYFFKLRVYAFKWQKMVRMRVAGLCGLVSRKQKMLSFAKWRTLYSLAGLRSRALYRIHLGWRKTIQGISFWRWSKMIKVEEISRLRTASEMSMRRLRSDSSLELVRQNEKYINLKREAGVALFFVVLKSVKSNVALVDIGWRRWKAVFWRSKEIEKRKEALLSRVFTSKTRRAFRLLAKNSRSVFVANNKEHCLKKVGSERNKLLCVA